MESMVHGLAIPLLVHEGKGMAGLYIINLKTMQSSFDVSPKRF
jgi:hypothetical protein